MTPETDLSTATPINQDNMSVPASHGDIDLSTAMPASADISMKMSNTSLARRFSDMKIWKQQAKPDVLGQATNAAVGFAIDSTVNFLANTADIMADMNQAVIEKRAADALKKRSQPGYNWLTDVNAFRGNIDIALAARNKGLPPQDTVFDRVTKVTGDYLRKNFPQKPGAINEWTYKLINGGLSVVESYAVMGMATALKATRLAQAMAPAFVIGAQQATGVSEEAEAQGKPMSTRLEAYFQDVIAQGALEAIGMDFLKNGLRGVKLGERLAIDSLNNALQEATQQMSEDGIRIAHGMSFESMSQIGQKVFDNAVVGAIIGPIASAVSLSAENRSIVGDFRKAGLSDNDIGMVIDEVMNKDFIFSGELARTLMQKGIPEQAATGAEKVVSDYGSKEVFKQGMGSLISDIKKKGFSTYDATVLAESIIGIDPNLLENAIKRDMNEMIVNYKNLDAFERVYLDVVNKIIKAGKPDGVDELTWASSAIMSGKVIAKREEAEAKRRKIPLWEYWESLGVDIQKGVSSQGNINQGVLNQNAVNNAVKIAKSNKLLFDILGGESFGFLTPSGKFIDGRNHGTHDKLANMLGFNSANDATASGLVRIQHSQYDMNFQVEVGNQYGYDQINEAIRQNVASDMWNEDTPIMIDLFKGNGLEHSTEFSVKEWMDKNQDLRDFLPTVLQQSGINQERISDAAKWIAEHPEGTAEEYAQSKPIVFHGSPEKFEQFDDALRGSATNAKSAKNAYFFTDSKEVAEGYQFGGMTKKHNELARKEEYLYRKAQKSGSKKDWAAYDKLISEMEGYEGIPQSTDTTQMVEATLDIKNPFIYDAKGKYAVDMEDDLGMLTENAKKNGHDAIIINNVDDTFDKSGKLSTVYGVFDKKQIKTKSQLISDFEKAKKAQGEESQPLFQKSADNPRAQVDLNAPNNRKVVTLFEKADVTGILHEFSHIWFYDMFVFVKSGKADSEYLQYYNTVKNWLGVDDNQSALTIEQQEKFAEGFESYLKQGIAPKNTDLQLAFDAFRKWMVRIYKSPEILGKPLSKEVRDFFDKMLGAEQVYTPQELIDSVSRETTYFKDTLKSFADSLDENEIGMMEFRVEQNNESIRNIDELRSKLFNRQTRKGRILDKEILSGEWQDIGKDIRKFFSPEGRPLDEIAQEWYGSHPRTDESLTPADEFRKLIIDTFVTNKDRYARMVSDNRALKAIISAKQMDSKAVDLGDVSEEEIYRWAKLNAERIYQESLVDSPERKIADKFMITMSQWMKDREKAARLGKEEGLREGKRIILAKLRLEKADVRRIKKEITDYATALLPKQYGKRAFPLIRDAESQDALIKAFIRINEMYDAYQRDLAINELRDIVGKIAKSESIDIGYKSKAIELMDKVELAKHTKETMERIRAMKKAVASGKVSEITSDMADDLAMLDRIGIERLTLNQIKGYQTKLEQLYEMARTKLRVRKDARELRKDVILMELAKGTKSMNYADEYRIVGRETTLTENLDRISAKLENLSSHIAMAITPIDVIYDELDGGTGSFNGVNFRTFKATLDAAFGRYLNRKDSFQLPLIRLAQELKLDQINFERIGIYAVGQQKGGLEKLTATLSPEQLKEMENITLTADEMKWYQEARYFLDMMLPMIEKVMYEEYNKTVDKVKGYFPFVTDTEALSDAEIQERMGKYAEEAIDNIRTVYRKNVRRGFTEKRVGGGQKINLNAFEVFMRHSDDVAYLIEMSKDLRLLKEVADSEKYEEIAGDKGRTFVRGWLDLMARKGGIIEGKKIAALDAIRRNIGVGTLGLKLTSMLVQSTSLADAAGRIGGDWVMRGVMNIQNADWVRLVMQMPEIRARAGDDPAYADIMRGKATGDIVWARKLQDISMRPLQYLDMLAAMSTAAGAYEKYMSEEGREIDFDNIDQRIMERVQLDIRRTQSSGFFKDAPMISTRGGLTGNVSLDKVIAQFNNFVMNRFSTIHETRSEFKEGDVVALSNRAFFFIIAIIAEQGIRAGIANLKDMINDDDKEYDVVQGIWNAILGNIPIVGNVLVSWVMGKEASVPIPAVSLLNDIVRYSSGIFSAKKPETRTKNIIRTVGSVARGMGYPVTEVQDFAVRSVPKGSNRMFPKRIRRNIKIKRKIKRRF